jgi:hypothetical protein
MQYCLMIACEIFSMIMGMGIFLDPWFEPFLHAVIYYVTIVII